jgi:hypothetical protein
LAATLPSTTAGLRAGQWMPGHTRIASTGHGLLRPTYGPCLQQKSAQVAVKLLDISFFHSLTHSPSIFVLTFIRLSINTTTHNRHPYQLNGCIPSGHVKWFPFDYRNTTSNMIMHILQYISYSLSS